MRQWIPISTSPKGRLALAAVAEFGSRPFDEVTVGELATAAEVTTGAIYHHFHHKLGLYLFVREDVERRVLDRMEGAFAAAKGDHDATGAVTTALVVGFDFAVEAGFLHLLGAPPAAAERDGLADMLSEATSSLVLGRILAASWRAALNAVAEGIPPAEARVALGSLAIRIPS